MSTNIALNFLRTDFPADATARQKLGHAVKCASLATPMEEWQPWQFYLADGHVELYANARRPSLPDDSVERELIIRCGAALLHLKLALKHLGCLGRVEIFPELALGGLVARVHHGSSRASGAQDTALFQAMGGADDKSISQNEAPVDECTLAMFEDSLAGGKAWLEFSQGPSSRSRLVALAESGNRIKVTARPRTAAAKPSRVAQWAKPLLTFVVRNDSGKFTMKTGGRRADEMTALAVIKTKTDDKHGWLATGQAMTQMKLLARSTEISSHIFDQAFRNRRVREELRTSVGHKGFVQAIIGLGLQSAQWPVALSAEQMAGDEFELDKDFPSHPRFD